MKGIIFFVIFSMFNITVGISYPTWFDTNVMVLAEEEERSSESGEGNLFAHPSAHMFFKPSCSRNIIYFDSGKLSATDVEKALSPGNYNIHDIPPEK